jgi:excisionase family DNA binding protein
VDVGQQVNATSRFSPDASPQLPVHGEHMSDSPNRKISIPQRFPASSTRIELHRPEIDLPSERLAFTYQQAADALQVSVSTIKRRIQDGALTVVMIGSLPRIPKSSIQQLLGED